MKSMAEALIEQGEKRGVKIGEERGEKRGRERVAVNLLGLGADVAFVMKASGLDKAEIAKLKASNGMA